MGIWLLLLALLGSVAGGPGLPRTGSVMHPVEVYELVRPAPPPTLKARSALLMGLGSRGVVYQLDAHGRHAPASLLKVATALVALEHLRLDQLVTVPVSINQLPWDSRRRGGGPGRALE